MPDVDNLLTSFYQLDDEARKEVVETIQFKLQYHRDSERAEQVKQIKGGGNCPILFYDNMFNVDN